MSRIAMVITCIRGLKTPLTTTHEPPSTVGGVIREDSVRLGVVGCRAPGRQLNLTFAAKAHRKTASP